MTWQQRTTMIAVQGDPQLHAGAVADANADAEARALISGAITGSIERGSISADDARQAYLAAMNSEAGGIATLTHAARDALENLGLMVPKIHGKIFLIAPDRNTVHSFICGETPFFFGRFNPPKGYNMPRTVSRMHFFVLPLGGSEVGILDLGSLMGIYAAEVGENPRLSTGYPFHGDRPMFRIDLNNPQWLTCGDVHVMLVYDSSVYAQKIQRAWREYRIRQLTRTSRSSNDGLIGW